jgi:leucyl/phenylalanyl-tRNA--protein transferase
MTQTHERAPNRRSITGQLLLMGHRLGVHPVPHGIDGRSLRWVGPTRPAILPLNSIRIPARMSETLHDRAWAVGVAPDPRPIIEACVSGARVPPRDWAEEPPSGWVEQEIQAAHLELAEAGQIQAIACRRHGRLVAGLFGMSIGAVFFGGGMFARVRDAGEVALAELLGRLRAGGFRFVDLHFLSGHSATVETAGQVRGRYRAPEAVLEAKARFPLTEEEFWPRALDDLEPAVATRHARVA